MASSINASVTNTGLIQSADASGVLQLQTDGTTGLTLNANANVTVSNTLIVSGNSSVTGNVTGGNVITGGTITATGNITSSGNLSASGNVYANGAPLATTGKSIAMSIIFGGLGG